MVRAFTQARQRSLNTMGELEIFQTSSPLSTRHAAWFSPRFAH